MISFYRFILQNEFTPQKAADLISKLLNPEKNEEKRNELKIVREKLGEQGASKRVAKSILEFVSHKI